MSPFTFARDIWQSSSKVEDNRALLKEVLQYPIADINRAKINDFLWVAEKDFSAAKSAEKYYRAHVESTEGFDFNQRGGLIPRSLLRNKLFQNVDEVIY